MSGTLAINGGEAVVPKGMIKSWPVITDEDKQAVMDVFDSGHIHGCSAPQAVALQDEWTEFCGCKYALVTNSGTSALHMAVAGAGIEPGDEVITSAHTYWSTAAAILHHNAIPVFADIDPDTFTIDPVDIEKRITPLTKGILAVHILGMPADMDPILEVARKHNLKVISDACQSHGAEYKGKKVGNLCDGTGFSLNRSKNLTSAEGGLYTTNDDAAYQYCSRMREFGEVIVPGQERQYNASVLGWMYRSVEFCNAFARSQLKRLPYNNGQRIEMSEYLTEKLKDIPGMSGPYTPPDRKPVYWTYTVKYDPAELGLDVDAKTFRLRAQKVFAAEGMTVGPWQHVPVPAQSVFQQKMGYGHGCPWTCCYKGNVEYKVDDYPKTWEFLATHVRVGAVHPPNGMDLMERYVEGFRKVMGQASEWAYREDLA
ncbi:MAG: DegT/DnrJ/EryC1/StrS family aminotransferase [Lentisphaerae bacterium]|jgi:perosamine synthetase|nr:DegT/DnrJ/EryC1/StrS family aminotransferase [Lentisphaerota bacterium]MBT5611130.1 DegT/DnrJ/EryC1/StrS family aminotransferase [Lentisphaerota bacterium]MBT7062262.1 DegT/DnrJ/EryC1/StrS family aminotransferase [Lentisphaerota bacterium]MBT7846619.1 DegT/DnrJ/EryC1/StrS family aminotransferase [Lentisphaerota bacterium]